MTSAAVYYHYPSKEAIFLSGITEVGQSYQAAIRQSVGYIGQGMSIGKIPADIIKWAEVTEGAYAYFIAAAGLSPDVEAERRHVQLEVLENLQRAVRRYRPELSAREVSVRAVALLSVTETAVGSVLMGDRATRGLTPSRFRAEVSAIAEQIASS
jgi:AcrR family transcriptional regulator